MSIIKLRSNAYRVEVTIAISTATSTAVDISNLRLRGVGVAFPAAWTNADLKLQAKIDDIWYDVYTDDHTQVKITSIEAPTADPQEIQNFPSEGWSVVGCDEIRVVSIDTADGSDENQGAARTLNLLLLG